MKKIILDLDSDRDTAFTLATVLAMRDVELIGVTCVYGQNTVRTASESVLRLLHNFGRDDIPVFLGLSRPINETPQTRFVTTNDSKINTTKLAKATRQISRQPAVDFLIDSALKYRENLIVVNTGANSNLAKAYERDARINHVIGRVIVIGGAMLISETDGNYAETNVDRDRYATNIVLQKSLNLVLVGLDATKQLDQSFTAQSADEKLNNTVKLTLTDSPTNVRDALALLVGMDLSSAKVLKANVVVNAKDGRTIRSFDSKRVGKTIDIVLDLDTQVYISQFKTLIRE